MDEVVSSGCENCKVKDTRIDQLEQKLEYALHMNKFLADECKRLKEAGWSFAVTKDSVRNSSQDYGSLKVEAHPSDEEQQKLDQLEAVFDPAGNLTTRLLKSATYTAPVPSTASPCGWYRPLNGSTVGVLDPAGNSTTRPYMP